MYEAYLSPRDWKCCTNWNIKKATARSSETINMK